MEPDITGPSWQQVNIAFPTWADAEPTAVAHLAPLLTTAESRGLITSWFFIRKAPCWRVRYLPERELAQVIAFINRSLEELKARGYLTKVTAIIYEPETHAFGGPKAMARAHRLFHQDSRHTLAYLADASGQNPGWRRELSIIVCMAMLRGAGLDWYEQGDVWAQVARHRQCVHAIREQNLGALCARMRQLMAAETADLLCGGAFPAFAAQWAEGFATAGCELADLAATGQLHRGLRAVLAHHIIFAWNRHGLPHATQAALASTAQLAVFGPDPAAQRTKKAGGP